MGIAGGVVVLFSDHGAHAPCRRILAVLGKHIDAGSFAKTSVPGAGSRLAAHRPQGHGAPGHGHRAHARARVGARRASFLHLETAAAYVGILPMKTESRATYERVLSDFPAQSANRILVVVQFPSEDLTLPRAHALRELRDRMAKLPGVVRVDSALDFDTTLAPEDAEKELAQPPSLRYAPATMALDMMSGKGVHVLTVETKGLPRRPKPATPSAPSARSGASPTGRSSWAASRPSTWT